jgi:uncharacterized protein
MEQLKQLLAESKVIAVYGASTNPQRSSCRITKYLMAKGYTVYPVSKVYAGKRLGGREILPSIADVPEPIDILDVFRRSEFLDEISIDTLKVKPKVVWLQLGISNPEVEQKFVDSGIQVVKDVCIYNVHSGKEGNI